MIQDILPHIFDNQIKEHAIQEEDLIFFFQQNQVLLKDGMGFYSYKDFCEVQQSALSDLTYCFRLDGIQVFASSFSKMEGQWHSLSVFRRIQPNYLGFMLITAYQCWLWNQNNHFCGRCGSPMEDSDTERAKVCPVCQNIAYPTIAPAIIVGIIDHDRILLAKNVNSHTGNYGLIAGYCEVGETLEETLRREVMEEVGLKVKNLRYYKSQPWGLSSSLLMGFFADLNGSDKITLQKSELSEAKWFIREQLEKRDVLDSLTSEMIDAFRKNKF